MAISLALTVVGAIIIFAIHGHPHLSGVPWLNIYAVGWIFLIIGILAFIVTAVSQHDSRWGRWFGGGGE